MQETVNCEINMGGDFLTKITGMTDATGKLNTEVKKSNGFVNELVARNKSWNFLLPSGRLGGGRLPIFNFHQGSPGWSSTTRMVKSG